MIWTLTRYAMAVTALAAVVGGCAAAPERTADEESSAMTSEERVVEATSLMGTPLYRPELSDERRVELEANLAAAQANHAEAPDDPGTIVWVGRRLGYLGRYTEAIAVYSKGLETHPDSPHLYRHRGHRYITTRKLAEAVADFERAATLIEGTPDEIEADGAPNAAGIPTSTLQSNIWYHLGLAHYLRGDFEPALAAFRRCMDVSKNDDMLVATTDWLYMTLRRLGREAEAANVLEPISTDMNILENTAYHSRLLMYKGQVEPDTLLNPEGTDGVQLATQGYGVANWYLYTGDTTRAEQIFQQILDGGSWGAFGYIAAEAELARKTGPAPGP